MFDELEEKIIDMAGFCGCGDPKSAIIFLGKVLHAIEFEKAGWDILEELIRCEDKGLFWSYLYFLDKMELTEHGFSIINAWLTDKGRELLELIDKYMETDND